MNVIAIYEGSDGDATKALYAALDKLGPIGLIAVNLFRAQKCSSRAKVYRGRSYKAEAYDRKNWSLSLLTLVLEKHAAELQIKWGWREDPRQEFHKWVLYVELPTGQVSFHTAIRGFGPDYLTEWDGKHLSDQRIVTWVQSLL